VNSAHSENSDGINLVSVGDLLVSDHINASGSNYGGLISASSLTGHLSIGGHDHGINTTSNLIGANVLIFAPRADAAVGPISTSGNLVSGNVSVIAGAGIALNGEVATTSFAVAGDVSLVTSIGSILLNLPPTNPDGIRMINTSATNLRG